MERAQNSDSETHVEMLDWTFGSDLSGKALCCIFFGTPCSCLQAMMMLMLYLQGVPKKMQHSDFLFRSVPEVQFNIFTCVSESEFRARSIWAHYR